MFTFINDIVFINSCYKHFYFINYSKIIFLYNLYITWYKYIYILRYYYNINIRALYIIYY